MGDTLRRRLVQTRFEGPHHEAALNLMLAAHHQRAQIERAFADVDLTLQQYNVLRILNGAHPDGHARCEIARRMLERAPDLTRLIDRLVERGLAERDRCREDARRSITRITARGRRLLDRLQPRVDEQRRDFELRLTPEQARQLSRLLERLYDPAD